MTTPETFTLFLQTSSAKDATYISFFSAGEAGFMTFQFKDPSGKIWPWDAYAESDRLTVPKDNPDDIVWEILFKDSGLTTVDGAQVKMTIDKPVKVGSVTYPAIGSGWGKPLSMAGYPNGFLFTIVNEAGDPTSWENASAISADTDGNLIEGR